MEIINIPSTTFGEIEVFADFNDGTYSYQKTGKDRAVTVDSLATEGGLVFFFSPDSRVFTTWE